MNSDFLDGRRRALEESFFAKKNRELLNKLKGELDSDAKNDAIKQATGISDDAVAEKLAAANIDAATVQALGLVPLVAVAWADGKLEDAEKQAVLKAAESAGLAAGSPSMQLLTGWLNEKPGSDVVDTWKDYVGGISETMDDAGKQNFQRDMLTRAKAVAEAAGGILGFGNKVNDAEQKVLDDLASAF